MPTVTLLQLKNRVFSRIDDNRLFYAESELTNAINECIRCFNNFTGMIQTTVPVGTGITEPGRVWYDVPESIFIPIRVQFEDTYLQKTFANQIGKSNATWVRDTTDNTALPVSQWVPCGFKKFAIHPADSLGGAALTMTGVAEPALLVNDTDTVVIPNEYTDPVVLMASQVVTIKETAALFKQSAAYYQQYLHIMKRASIWRGTVMPKFYIPETVQKD